ncbi:hypothetical protein [Microbulbifer variabilis]|uniref:hypothetical protein n=1 Tax=Microbulbifer variabilis TaxID=266805 RepID=UPI001CFE83EC|nr:hypothetical protein [Microbulbifer variabilis]
MYIRSLWVDHQGETEQLLQSLEEYLSGLTHLPGLVYIVSAGEANVLLERPAIEFLAQLEEAGHNIQFVGSACTSFHAALLSYSKRQEEDALIINLELGKERQQECLDALGIGVKAGQDGLDVITGVAVCWLSKHYHAESVCQISSCDILSQAPTLSGAHELVQSLKKIMTTDFSHSCRIVSFDIQSRWAKGLLKGFSREEKSQWLPSSELDGQHYLSIKPIVEINKYCLESEVENLWIITLGGGGRAGCLRVHRTPRMEGQLLSRLVHTETLSLEEAYANFTAAQNIEGAHGQDYLPHVRGAMIYPQKKYRGRHNQIFHWVLGSGSWRSLLENQGAKHG